MLPLNPIDSHIGRQLRVIRQQRGMNIETLAAAIGVAPETIRQYEQGKQRIHARHLLHLSKILQLQIAELFKNIPAATAMASEPANDEECRTLVKNFKRIDDSAVRRMISSLVASCAEKQNAMKG